jgi:hypothetical protein
MSWLFSRAKTTHQKLVGVDYVPLAHSKYFKVMLKEQIQECMRKLRKEHREFNMWITCVKGSRARTLPMRPGPVIKARVSIASMS